VEGIIGYCFLKNRSVFSSLSESYDKGAGTIKNYREE
jgi:hypothetical protein